MKRLIIALIAAYQRYLSPLLGARCRFYPSCSEYCRQSLEKNGLRRGSVRALKRILKCHPFHPGGFDPVE